MRKIVKNEPRRPLPAAVGAAHWTRSGPVLVPNAPPADWNSTRERATPIGVPLHRIYGRSDYIPRNQKLRQKDSCFQGRAGGGEKENITLSVPVCVSALALPLRRSPASLWAAFARLGRAGGLYGAIHCFPDRAVTPTRLGGFPADFRLLRTGIKKRTHMGPPLAWAHRRIMFS